MLVDWLHADDEPGSLVVPDDYQQRDALPAALPEDPWPHWHDPEGDDAPRLADESAPVVANVAAAVPALPEDNWPHWHDAEDDATTQAADESDPVVADVVAAPDAPPQDAPAFDDELVAAGPVPDDYQQHDAPPIVVDELGPDTGPLFDGGDEDLDELVIDDFAAFDPEQPPEHDWCDDELEDVSWAMLDGPVGADAQAPVADQPPVDAWGWDDSVEDEQPVDAVLGADAVVAQDPPAADVWTWDDTVEDEQGADAVLSADAVVVQDLPAADAWGWDDSVEDEQAVDAVLADDVVPAQDMPVADAWAWDDTVEDEQVVDAVLGADVVPAQDMPVADAWAWDDTVEDEQPVDAVLGADVALVQDLPTADGWPWEDAADDDLNLDAAPVADATVAPDALPVDAWSWDEPADDEAAAFDSAPVAVALPDGPVADAWPWDDTTEQTEPDDCSAILGEDATGPTFHPGNPLLWVPRRRGRVWVVDARGVRVFEPASRSRLWRETHDERS